MPDVIEVKVAEPGAPVIVQALPEGGAVVGPDFRTHDDGERVRIASGYSAVVKDGMAKVLPPEGGALEPGGPAFEVYSDSSGEWRWRLVARNGEVIADSAEGYSDKSGVAEAVDRVRRVAFFAEMTGPEV